MTVERARPIVRLEVTSIAAGGDGVAHVDRPDGRRAVFVAHSAPGDVVEGEVDFSARPARAASLRLLQASPLRVEPECPWVGSCGGCDLMHLSLDAQREAHRAMVVSALERGLAAVGAVVGLPSVTAHAAPAARGYRTRTRLAIHATRARTVVGYRRAGQHIVQSVDSCLILDPRLDRALADLRGLFEREVGEGEATVALGAKGAPVLDIAWTGELSPRFFSRVGLAVDGGHYAGAEIWLSGARRAAPFGDPSVVTQGADGEPLAVPSGSFAQAHPAANLALGERLLAAARPAGKQVVELFAGSGNFTVLLARQAASLVAVESDRRAVTAAHANLRARGLRAKVVEADADAFELPANARTVVLDPPRGGAPGASRRLAKSKVRRIAYVSCDASTLGRDVGVLAAAGFVVTGIDTFEMFPHTSHVESLVVLERDP